MSRPAPDFSLEPAAVLRGMAREFSSVQAEIVDLASAAGRVLASPVTADRDHPSCDISAVDGYAVRMGDGLPASLPVIADVRIGQSPPGAKEVGAVKIVTGAPVPAGFDAILRRETLIEHSDRIEIPAGLAVKLNQDLRRQGENLRAGQTVVEPGELVTPSVIGALATFGGSRPKIFRRIRVSLIVGGDELLPVESQPQPWQIRDSHGWALPAMFGHVAWIEWRGVRRVGDDAAATASALSAAMEESDAVILTGGVSMGDRDFVPAAIQQCGARILFHGLPIRPGKPTLGAMGPKGTAILGLPGNPLSVLVTARRFASIVLRRLAGVSEIDPPATRIESDIEPDAKFWFYRPVKLERNGPARRVPVQSSGDLVAGSRADGFVEIPPLPSPAALGERKIAHFAYYPWNLT